MSLEVTVMHPKHEPAKVADFREELVHRVASSATFEKSPRLRAFFLHVCRCAIEAKPEAATEQQIGIFVYGRQPGYNPNDDNIVRSQARVLRMKLEHHFANEGRDELVVISIPKGQYLPIFEARPERPHQMAMISAPVDRETLSPRWAFAAIVLLFAFLVVWLGFLLWNKSSHANWASSAVPATELSEHVPSEAPLQPPKQRAAPATSIGRGEVRIAAGYTGAPYVDAEGRIWNADHYYEGGVVGPGPKHLFPPVPDAEPFRSLRQAASDDIMVPQSERGFQYNIPLPPEDYELRLYFADPLRQPDADQQEDAQNERHFQVSINGHAVLNDLDPVTDAGSAAVDVRAFKDVRPAADSKLHLDFHSNWGRPAFVSAIELTPGTSGKLNPIRIVAGRRSDFVEFDGTHWSGDRYYIDGRTWLYPNPVNGPRIPALYTGERHGNFSYAIPVPPGSYIVRLYFLESFFSPLIPAANCQGVGCRVFDVTCNGVTLLQDFDIVQAADGAFRPVIREFHDLHPNGQGKLLISFSPKANYAEVRAIEVIDEGK